MIAIKRDIVKGALAAVEENLTKKIKKSSGNEQLKADTISYIEIATTVGDAKSGDLVIEAIPEVLELKVGARGTA